jgi:hypothetical protein
MPIAENLVTWEVEEDLAAAPRDTLQDAVLISGYESDDEPDAGFFELTQHSTAEGVADDYGEDSDMHEGAKQFFRSGAQSVRTLAFPLEEHSESFDNTDEFSLENGPVTGLEPVSATLDGDDVDVVHVTESPPSLDEAQDLYVGSGETYTVQSGDTETYTTAEIDGEVESSGTLELQGEGVTGTAIALNSDTGEGVASESAAIEVEYYSVPWGEVFSALENRSINMIDLANHNYGYESIGDMDELVPWQDANEVMRVQPYKNGQAFDRPEDALQLAQEVGAYSPSPWTIALSHESPTNGLGAKALGLYAVEDAGFNIFQESFNVSIPNNSRYQRLVGSPDQDGTFEGGDDGSGPSNVLYSDQGTVRWSNSLTTAGISDDYRYLDRTRRKAFARNRATQAVKERLQNGVTFDSASQAAIEGAIEDELRNYVGTGQMFLSMDVTVPDRDDTARQDRANRIWEGTRLELVLNEPAHRMEGTISLTL